MKHLMFLGLCGLEGRTRCGSGELEEGGGVLGELAGSGGRDEVVVVLNTSKVDDGLAV